jgi:hypothetical protein
MPTGHGQKQPAPAPQGNVAGGEDGTGRPLARVSKLMTMFHGLGRVTSVPIALSFCSTFMLDSGFAP